MAPMSSELTTARSGPLGRRLAWILGIAAASVAGGGALICHREIAIAWRSMQLRWEPEKLLPWAEAEQEADKREAARRFARTEAGAAQFVSFVVRESQERDSQLEEVLKNWKNGGPTATSADEMPTEAFFGGWTGRICDFWYSSGVYPQSSRLLKRSWLPLPFQHHAGMLALLAEVLGRDVQVPEHPGLRFTFFRADDAHTHFPQLGHYKEMRKAALEVNVELPGYICAVRRAEQVTQRVP